MPRQTRRSAKAREAATSSDDETSQVAMNGNGSAHHEPEVSDDAPTTGENIFMFWPNIIGASLI